MARRVNGDAVRAIREALGISQAALARRAGITGSALSQMENGLSGARPEVARRLATELGVAFEAITSPSRDEVPA